MVFITKGGYLTVGILMLIIFGCTDHKITALEEKVKKLDQRVKELEPPRGFTEVFPSDLSLLGTDVATEEESSYFLLNTQFGKFPIKVKEIKPFLNGYKVCLLIGNPTTMTFSGARINIRWGHILKTEDLFDENATGKKTGATPNKAFPNNHGLPKKEKSFDSLSSFPPGQYTSFEVTLTPAKPEEVKIINVAAIFDKLSLLKVGK